MNLENELAKKEALEKAEREKSYLILWRLQKKSVQLIKYQKHLLSVF
mgnify:CR=1 FL=1